MSEEEEEDRQKVLQDAILDREEMLGLKNHELTKIFNLEKEVIHEEDARDLGDDIDELIKDSIKGLNLEEFLKEENEVEQTTEGTEDTNDS